MNIVKKTATLSKSSVAYRIARGKAFHRCGNCAMFHPQKGTCDIVKGHIDADYTCDRWAQR